MPSTSSSCHRLTFLWIRSELEYVSLDLSEFAEFRSDADRRAALTGDVLYVSPPSPSYVQHQEASPSVPNPHDPGKCARLSGFIHVASPTRRAIRSLVVRNRLIAKIGFFGSSGLKGGISEWEEETIFDMSLSLGEEEGGVVLDIGLTTCVLICLICGHSPGIVSMSTCGKLSRRWAIAWDMS